MLNQTLCAQAQAAYDVACNSPSSDWRAVAELFRAAMQAERPKRAAKPKAIGRPRRITALTASSFYADPRELPFALPTGRRCSRTCRRLPASPSISVAHCGLR